MFKRKRFANTYSVERMFAYSCLYWSVLKLKILDMVRNVGIVKHALKIEVLMQQTEERSSLTLSFSLSLVVCVTALPREGEETCAWAKVTIAFKWPYSIKSCSCEGNANRSDTYSEPASQMVKFWRGKGGSRKEECSADDQEQKELKTRYSNGCYGAVIPQYCLCLLRA